MNENGIMPVMPVGGNDGFMGGNGIWLFSILILFMLCGGNGFGWGNNGFANALGYENLATSNEVQRGFADQNLNAQTRDILTAVTNGTAQAVAATNNSTHDIYAALNDKYGEIARDIAGVSVQQANTIAAMNECCCGTKMAIAEAAGGLNASIAQNRYENALGLAGVNSNIAQVRYDDALNTASINSGLAQNKYEAALNTAAINENTTAQIQSLKDLIQQNKIEALQGQVNQLQLAQATAGVLRYPTSWTYGAGPFPPLYGNCPCTT